VATGGLGALIPLVDFGKRGDSNCSALIDRARTDAGVRAADMKSVTRH
jgi:hypothetical protein